MIYSDKNGKRRTRHDNFIFWLPSRLKPFVLKFPNNFGGSSWRNRWFSSECAEYNGSLSVFPLSFMLSRKLISFGYLPPPKWKRDLHIYYYYYYFLISFFRFSKSLGYQLLSEESINIGDCYHNNWWHFDGESWNKKPQSKQANRLKRNRTWLTKSSLVLILNIDGWEFVSGATKANPHYLRHSTGNCSVYHSENLEIPELHSWKYIFSSNHWLWC